MGKRYPLINEVYESALKNLDEEDKDINEKKRVIREQIHAYKKKMESIQENAKQVTEEIQVSLDNALKDA